MAIGSPSPFQRIGQGTPIVPANGTVVDIPPDPTVFGSGGESIFENDDGMITVDLDPKPAIALIDAPHGDNLAKYLAPDVLTNLGTSLCQAIDQDLESRREWESTLATGLRYLGTQITEGRTTPFKGASGVYDSVMLTALVRFQATAFKELQPAGGPVKAKVTGAETEAATAAGFRVKSFLNLYLTDLAPEYRPEYRRMLWWVGLEGGAFKKLYEDPVLNRPVSPYIRAEDIIVPYAATDLWTTPRITHRFPLTDREVKTKVLAGEYLDVTLLEEDDAGISTRDTVRTAIDAAIGLRKTKGEIDKNYVFYETHAYLDLEGFEHTEPDGQGGQAATGLPLPYRVTIEKNSQKVVAVYKNWAETDPTLQRKDWFVYYPFVPGMGFYGLGYAHLLGNTAMAATALRRQTIDAATLSMMPSGVRAKGARFADNNVQVRPLEFPEVDTGGQPIGNFIMPFSFKGADPTSIALLQETYKQGEQIASTSEIAVGEGRQDAPVGTTMALLEASTRVESSIVAGLHDALKLELRMLTALFGEHLPDDEEYPYEVQGVSPNGEPILMKPDFQAQTNVIPVSDPNISSGTQRLIRAQAQLQFAQQAPQIHDLREAYYLMYVEMGLDEVRINKLLPPPQQTKPMDPLSENMAALTQKPIAVGPAQNHQAHIAVHQALVQLPNMVAHIQEHMAWAMRIQVEQALGHPLPPPGAPMDPNMENQIAVQVAQVMQQLQAQAAAQAPGGAEDPQTQLAEKALQTQMVATMQKASQAEIQSRTELTKATIQSEDKASDRAAKVHIAEIKATAQEQSHGIDNPNLPQ